MLYFFRKRAHVECLAVFFRNQHERLRLKQTRAAVARSTQVERVV
jgi:hypothetical protein